MRGGRIRGQVIAVVDEDLVEKVTSLVEDLMTAVEVGDLEAAQEATAELRAMKQQYDGEPSWELEKNKVPLN